MSGPVLVEDAPATELLEAPDHVQGVEITLNEPEPAIPEVEAQTQPQPQTEQDHPQPPAADRAESINSDATRTDAEDQAEQHETTDTAPAKMSPTLTSAMPIPIGGMPLPNSPPNDDPLQAVDGLVRAMRGLTADPNYKLVADVFSEFLFLKDRNARLQLSNRELMEEYRTFRNELEASEAKLRKEKNALEGIVQEKTRELVELGVQKTVLQSEKQMLEGKVADRETSIAVLESLKMALEDEKAQLEATLQEKEKALEELGAARDALTEERDRLVEEKTALEATVDAKSKEIEDLTAARDKLEEEKAALEATVEEKTKEIEDLTAAKTQLEADKASLEATVEEKTKEIEDLTAAKTQLEDDKALLEATVEEKLAQIEELSAAKADLETKLAETTATLEEERAKAQAAAEASAEEIASLQGTIKERDEEIESLKGQLQSETERADGLEAKLKDTEQELQLMTGKFEDLARYRVELVNEPEDTCVNIFDEIWTSIQPIVETTFREDIHDDILTDPSCWSNLRHSEYLKHATAIALPLPHSNSTAAKAMRISVVLAILSRSLAKHIFRPVFLMDNDDNLASLLHEVEDEDPSWELHLRSTLMAILPEKQQVVAKKRAQSVVRDVAWVVQHLLGALAFENFSTTLAKACAQASAEWMRVQNAQLKVEPYFGPPYDDYDWQRLDIAEFNDSDYYTKGHRYSYSGSTTAVDASEGEPPQTPTTDVDSANDETIPADPDASTVTATTADTETTDEHSDSASTSATTSSSLLEPSEILFVVWPSLCAVEGGELSSMTQGLVVSKDQARPAMEEVRARMGPRMNSRRARSMSMAGRSVDLSVSGRHRRGMESGSSVADAGEASPGGADE